MNIDEITIADAKRIAAMFGSDAKPPHPMIGRRCLIRTYSAGVHVGTVASINGMEVHLRDALRIWKWTGGGLSCSSIATVGMLGGRVNKTGEIYLTNVIEMIPTTAEAEATYVKFIER